MKERLQAIRDTPDVLCEEGSVYELRALGVPEDWTDSTFTNSGYFDDFDALAATAAKLDRKGATGVYITPNPVDPDLLARAKNRTVRSPKSTTTNDEIQRRRWLLLDFDSAQKPKGVSATDEEKAAAMQRAKEAARFLADEGWPGGVYADSGNAAHLMYRIDEAADDGGLCKRVNGALAVRFSDEVVSVDAVHNAARIWKLYGTTARKGDPLDHRPHRRAKIIRVADPLEVVPTEKLRDLAASAETDDGERPTNTDAPGTGRESGRRAQADGLPVEEVRRALRCIPPRPDYDEWIRIAAAVLDAVGGEVDTAERLLMEWSAEEEKGEYRRKLESGFDGSITAATLIHVAKGHGYVHPARRNGSSGKRRKAPKKPKQTAKDEGSGEKKKKRTHTQVLLDLAASCDLFHTPRGEPFATFEADGHRRTAAVGGSTFANFLRRGFREERSKPPSAQALTDATNAVRADAEFDGEEREANVRIAGHDGRVYVDLCNDDYEVVEIDAEGWRIKAAADVPVRFRRTKGMTALPKPPETGGAPGEALSRLRKYVRVKNDGEFALLLGVLIQALRPVGPYPVLTFIGEQGSGKTTASKIVRALTDPSAVPTSTRPRNGRDLAISAENSWTLVFNNLSGLKPWLSDAFCRLSDGSGRRVRTHYANREEELFYATRPLVLNGIEDLTTRGDLARRAVVIELEPIPIEEKQLEREFWAAFRCDRPHIVGGLFDAVSAALASDAPVPSGLPGLVDFAAFAHRAEAAFPGRDTLFLDAYRFNRKEKSANAVENNVVATAIRALVEDRDEWVGKTKELLEALEGYAPDPLPHDFPGSFQKLAGVLRRIMPALRSVGIYREDGHGPKGRAFRLCTKVDESASAGGSAAPEGSGKQRSKKAASKPVNDDSSAASADSAAFAVHSKGTGVSSEQALASNGRPKRVDSTGDADGFDPVAWEEERRESIIDDLNEN